MKICTETAEGKEIKTSTASIPGCIASLPIRQLTIFAAVNFAGRAGKIAGMKIPLNMCACRVQRNGWWQKRYQKHELISNSSIRCSGVSYIGIGIAQAA